METEIYLRHRDGTGNQEERTYLEHFKSDERGVIKVPAGSRQELLVRALQYHGEYEKADPAFLLDNGYIEPLPMVEQEHVVMMPPVKTITTTAKIEKVQKAEPLPVSSEIKRPPKCTYILANKQRCKGKAMRGDDRCFNHNRIKMNKKVKAEPQVMAKPKQALKPEVPTGCSFFKPDGTKCKGRLVKGDDRCWNHGRKRLMKSKKSAAKATKYDDDKIPF